MGAAGRGREPSAGGPMCLGLTGGIGSGKSAALERFGRLGAATLSSDAVVHGLYARPDVIQAVTERFGGDVLRPDGSVDRSALGARAFSEPGGIRFLEGLLHPRIGAAREEWVAARRAAGAPLLVCEVPLLFEAGLRDAFDAVLVVTASDEVRRARVEARGQVFAERAGLQWDEARKVAEADHAFTNDGDMAALEAWVAEMYGRYAPPVP